MFIHPSVKRSAGKKPRKLNSETKATARVYLRELSYTKIAPAAAVVPANVIRSRAVSHQRLPTANSTNFLSASGESRQGSWNVIPLPTWSSAQSSGTQKYESGLDSKQDKLALLARYTVAPPRIPDKIRLSQAKRFTNGWAVGSRPYRKP